MNLLLCDKCARRNIMCFNCVDHKYYMESNFSHDEYIKKIAVKEFATKIMERLEKQLIPSNYDIGNIRWNGAIKKAIEIVKEEM